MLLDSDRNRIIHMIRAAEEVMTYTRNRSREDLEFDRPLQHLVVRNLEILGEAASRITAEFRSAHPEVPWSQILGMRNRIVHAYHNIDLDIVWNTVVADVPSVLAKLKAILEQPDA